MTTYNPSEQLDYLIRSRRPVVQIISPEERRIQALVCELAEARPVKVGKDSLTRVVWAWSKVQGLRQISPVNPVTGVVPVDARPPAWRMLDDDKYLAKAKEFAGETTNPEVALFRMSEWATMVCTTNGEDGPEATVYPTVFFAADLGINFVNQKGEIYNVTTARRVRELAFVLPSTKNTLILIDPVAVRVPWLDKDVTVIDWPLPSKSEMAALLDSRIKRMDAKSVKLNGSREKLVRALAGLTYTEADNALSLAITLNKGVLDGRAIQVVITEKSRVVKSSGVLEYIPEGLSMADIGGLWNLKKYLARKRLSFSEKAASRKLRPPKGVFLLGVSGSGKSMAAKAAANGEMPILKFNMGMVLSKWQGDSEHNLIFVFILAALLAPCIFWIDEVEKLFSGVMEGSGDNGTRKALFGAFLTFMQESTAGVYCVATANSIDGIPVEFLSRFDDVIFTPTPSTKARAEIFSVQLRAIDVDPAKFNLSKLAQATPNYVGREIEKIVVTANELAFGDGDRPITEADLLNAVKLVRSTYQINPKPFNDLMAAAKERRMIDAEVEDDERAQVFAGVAAVPELEYEEVA